MWLGDARMNLDLVKGIFDQRVVDRFDKDLPVDPCAEIHLHVDDMPQDRPPTSPKGLEVMAACEPGEVWHRLKFEFDASSGKILRHPVADKGMPSTRARHEAAIQNHWRPPLAWPYLILISGQRIQMTANRI
jgi:hypothetical protein